MSADSPDFFQKLEESVRAGIAAGLRERDIDPSDPSAKYGRNSAEMAARAEMANELKEISDTLKEILAVLQTQSGGEL